MSRWVAVVGLLALGCAPGAPVCEVANSSRCDGTRAQVCTPARDEWYTYRDCARLRPVDGVQMVCCASAASGGHTCLLPAHCAGATP